MQWIKTTERLPTKQDPIVSHFSVGVWVHSAECGQYKAHYNFTNGVWIACTPYYYEELEGVTHWAPITPPTEGE